MTYFLLPFETAPCLLVGPRSREKMRGNPTIKKKTKSTPQNSSRRFEVRTICGIPSDADILQSCFIYLKSGNRKMLLTFVFLITVIVIMTMIMMTMMMIVETLTNITVVIPHLNFCALNLSSFQYIIIISSNTLLSLYLRTRHSLLL